MKKTNLLNSNLSTVISRMGHKQTITIGDAGLPVPKGVERIDLAVVKGVPDFFTVLDAVLSELCVEKIILAEEIVETTPDVYREIMNRFPNVEVAYVPHEQFKEYTKDSEVIVRTGATTSFTNVILVSGVTF